MSTDSNGSADPISSVENPSDGPPALELDHARFAKPSGGNVPQRQGAEHYDWILWKLSSQMTDAGSAGYALGLTSCQRRSGVTTVATNLAIRAADHGLGPVLVVDCNLRFPRASRLLRARPGPGLAELFAGQASLGECIRTTSISGMDLLPLGSENLADGAGIDPAALGGILDELRGSYRLIVFDLAEEGQLRHTLLVAQRLDAALLVIRAERVPRRTAQAALQRLVADGVNLLGAVVTEERRYVPAWLERRL